MATAQSAKRCHGEQPHEPARRFRYGTNVGDSRRHIGALPLPEVEKIYFGVVVKIALGAARDRLLEVVATEAVVNQVDVPVQLTKKDTKKR